MKGKTQASKKPEREASMGGGLWERWQQLRALERLPERLSPFASLGKTRRFRSFLESAGLAAPAPSAPSATSAIATSTEKFPRRSTALLPRGSRWQYPADEGNIPLTGRARQHVPHRQRSRGFQEPLSSHAALKGHRPRRGRKVVSACTGITSRTIPRRRRQPRHRQHPSPTTTRSFGIQGRQSRRDDGSAHP